MSSGRGAAAGGMAGSEDGEHRSFRWGGALVLGAVGFLVNLLAVQISPGTDLIFGGVFYLLAAVALGPLPGLMAAAVASSRTLWLWNHPFAWLIFSAEALTVGWMVRRWRLRPVLADLLYWTFLGLPLFALTYHLVLGFTGTTAQVVFLKQVLNGLMDALLVETLLLFPAVRRWLRVRVAPRLRFTLAAVVALSAVLPALSFGIWVGRQEWERNVARAEERALLFADAYSSRLEQYIMLHERAVRTVAQAMERRGTWDPAQLQRLLDAEQDQFSGFVNMYAADARATVIAFAPQSHPRGESVVGQNFSDRTYYRELLRTRETVISDVFAGRGGVDAPLVVIASPVVLGDTLTGYVLGALDLGRFPAPTELRGRQSLRVADHAGTLVLHSGDPYTTGERPRAAADSIVLRAVRETGAGGITSYLPGDVTAAPAVAASRVLAGVATVPSVGWWVWVEQPFAEIQEFVAEQYVRLFVLLVVVMLVALVVSGLLAQLLAEPLVRLQNAAAALARGDLDARVGRLPATAPAELDGLGRGFDEMAQTLARREGEMRDLTIAAQTASRAKSDFITTMSHELRTPLNAVLGHLELLEMGIHGALNEAQAQAVERVRVASRHLRGLIEEVLSFSRLEAGRVEVREQEVDPRALVREVEAVVEPLAREKGLELRTELDDPVPLRTDPDKVRQILINLAGNAVKFTERGEIVIALTRRAGGVELSVRDTGVGISPEDQTRLFRPFEQLDSGLSRRHGGTGLGLYLSRRYAELLGGQLTVRSRPGEGSEFSLLLPDGRGNREEERREQ